MHIGYVPRERPPFSALNFRSGAYHFHKLPKNPFRRITILYFLADFAVPETIIFKISLISTRSSPPTAGRPRVSSWPERQPDASWQFRRLAFSRSKRIKLVPEPRIFKLKTAQARPEPRIFTLDRKLVPEPLPIFTLPRHIPTKIWGEYPPPRGGGGGSPQVAAWGSNSEPSKRFILHATSYGEDLKATRRHGCDTGCVYHLSQVRNTFQYPLSKRVKNKRKAFLTP